MITATALDQYGMPIAGMPVTFLTSDPLGSGALTPLGPATNASGQVMATLRSTLVGAVRVTAEASSGTSDSITLVFRSATFCALQLWAVPDTGPEPRAIALDTAGRRAFIAHAEGITVIDADDFAVINEIRSLALAHGIAYDPDNNRIWVTTRDGTGRVRVLDGTTYAIVGDLPAGSLPHAAAYNPANGRVYVTNYGSNTVGVYLATSIALERTLTGFREPAHVAANPVTNKVYVANHQPNGGVTVIDGATHSVRLINTALIDAYGVAVDSTRNLIYVTAIDQGRISIIDGAADSQIGSADIRRGTGETVPLRVIAVNPDVGPEGHLIVATSSEDGGQDQLLLIPNGWPTLGTPVPLNITSYPQEGIALDRTTDLVWATSVSSGQVNVARDGLPVCSIPFLHNAEVGEENLFQVEKLAVP
jgi:DNA-binding beta-propeller fold protein YncE